MKSLTIVLLMLSLQTVMGFGLRDLEEPIKKCSVPQKFEGKLKFTVKKLYRWVQIATGTGTIHVDYTIGKSATFEKVVVNRETTDFRIYFSNNIVYTVTPSKNVCKKDMDKGILPIMIPTEVNIKRGVLQGVQVQIWKFSLNLGLESGTLYLTEDKCMFVKFELEKIAQGMYMTEDFYDMKEGIKDASVFNLPRNCVKRSYYGNSHRLPQSSSSSSLKGFNLLITCVVFLGKHLG